MILLLFISFNLLLAVSVGPFVAISLIPRCSPAFSAGLTSVWLDGREDILYLKHLEAAHISPNCSIASIAVAVGTDCPSSQ